MKKLLGLVLIIMLLVCSFSFTTYAIEDVWDVIYGGFCIVPDSKGGKHFGYVEAENMDFDNYYLKVPVLLLGGTGWVREVPENLYNYNYDTIEKLVVPEGVTEIGAEDSSDLYSVWKYSDFGYIGASDSCCSMDNLKELVLPSSLKVINKGSFRNCPNLKTVTLKNGVKKICSRAFEETGIEKIVIPGSVEELEYGAFLNCKSLKTVEFLNGSGSIKIDEGTFAGCDNLETIILSNKSFTYDDSYGSPFRRCEGLKNVKYQDGASNIPDNFWAYQTSIENVELANSISSIGEYAFRECSNLKKINIPSKLGIIEEGAFYNCASLKNVSLPKGVAKIGTNAFSECTSLESVKLSNTVEIIGSSSFYNCSALKNIVIPNSVKEIESYAFSGCSSLKNVSIPSSVKKLNYGTFARCTNLEKVDIPKKVEMEFWSRFNGYSEIFEYDDKVVLYVENDSEALSYAKQKGIKYVITDLSKDNESKENTNTDTDNKKDNKSVPFNDVDASAWYYSAVKYSYDNNIIAGYDSNTFAPNDNLTRGMLVTILYRMENSPKNDGNTSFSDVNSDKWYSKPIRWAVDNEIVHGYAGSSRFGPNDNITRQDLAVILRNYAKYKNKNINVKGDVTKFRDSREISGYAYPAVQWAVGSKVITGNADKTLRPLGYATRAEAAAMIQKYCYNVGR